MGVCNFSISCCTLFYVHCSFVIIFIGKRELVALLSSWCLVIVMWFFIAVPWLCLQFVIVVFPDHTHLQFFSKKKIHFSCEGRVETSTLGITVCHHSASLIMQIGDPRDRFFYPNLTLMVDSYRILNQIRCQQKGS